jgi:hypothetical protein
MKAEMIIDLNTDMLGPPRRRRFRGSASSLIKLPLTRWIRKFSGRLDFDCQIVDQVPENRTERAENTSPSRLDATVLISRGQ